MFFFGTLLTAALCSLIAYVLWRAASVPLLAGRLSRRGLLLVGVGLAATFFVAQAVGHGGTGRVAAAVQWIGMTLLGTLFIVATTLLAADVATGFGLLLRRRAPWLRGAAILAGLFLAALALVQGHRAPEIGSYELTLPSLPRALDGKVVVALSDTHLGSDLGADWFAERIGEVQALRPDLVLFLGDIFEGHGEAPRELGALRALAAPLGKGLDDGLSVRLKCLSACSRRTDARLAPRRPRLATRRRTGSWMPPRGSSRNAASRQCRCEASSRRRG